MSQDRIKLLHMADIHLQRSFGQSSRLVVDQELRREELWLSLEGSLSYALDSGVSCVLIAGDIFENGTMTFANLERLAYIFNSFKDLDIFIVFGNHDHIGRKTNYLKTLVGPNIYIFDDKLTYIEKGGLRIYGFSWSRLNYSTMPFSYPKLDPSYFNILLVHGTDSIRSDYLPLDINQLEDVGFDYIALGHIHKRQKTGKKAFYPGSLEPLDASELGPHGPILVEIIGRDIKVEFLDLASRTYHNLKYDLSDEWDNFGLANSIKKLISTYEESDLLSIELEGLRDQNIDIDEFASHLELSHENIKIIDKTSLAIDLDRIIEDNQDNIIGEYFSYVGKNYQGQKKEMLIQIGIDAVLKEYIFED